MTDEQIQELKKLCNQAQQGPWYAHVEQGSYEGGTYDACFVSPYEHDPCDAICAMDGGNFSNFQLMAAAREALPALIEALEQANSRIAYYEGKAESLVENALGVVGHRFDSEGKCIRCGTDAEDCDIPCTEGILKDLGQAEAIIQCIDQAGFNLSLVLPSTPLSYWAREKLTEGNHPAFVDPPPDQS